MVKAIPLGASTGPYGSRRERPQNFYAIGTLRWYGCQHHALATFIPLGDIPGTHFCYELSPPQRHSVTRRIKLMKNLNDPIANRTLDLSDCSVVRQPTMPPRTSVKSLKRLKKYIVQSVYRISYCLNCKPTSSELIHLRVQCYILVPRGCQYYYGWM
jgi:hypothetical protein